LTKARTRSSPKLASTQPIAPHSFVSHAAGVDHSDVGGFRRLQVALRGKALAQLLRIDMRDLAAEKIDAETRHDARMLADFGGYAGGVRRRVRSA
jgi:hypothetical protein